MRLSWLVILLPLALGGCFVTNPPPPPPAHTTIVVPQGSTVTCSDGSAPPCQ
ncbi:MAG TPA: hypothetical protein VNE67_12230 [Acetobacteraceae bacterium]|nr:hypothetical protein [Acetobacteraceae bacterium]